MDLSVTMLRLSPKADAKEEEKPEETPFFGNLIFSLSHFTFPTFFLIINDCLMIFPTPTQILGRSIFFSVTHMVKYGMFSHVFPIEMRQFANFEPPTHHQHDQFSVWVI